MAASRSRARWAWIAAGVAGVTAALLLVGGEGLRGALDALTRPAPEEQNAPLLGGAALDTTSESGPTLHGTQRPAPTESESARGPLTVTVLDRAGRPIAGVSVLCGTVPRSSKSEARSLGECTTDAAGRTSFEDVPYDGSALVGARLQRQGTNDVLSAGLVASPDIRIEARAERIWLASAAEPDVVWRSGIPPTVLFADVRAVVSGPEVTLTLDAGMPLEVDVRGTDHRRRSARWQVTPRLEWAADAFESPRLALTGGEQAAVTLKVEPPSGTVAYPWVWNVWIHPQAARLFAVAPLRDEVRVLAQFPPEVLPFREEQWNLEARVGGQPLPSLRLEARGDGLVEVHGFPHMVGDTVALGGTLGDAWTVQGSAVMGPDPRAPVVVRMTCEPKQEETPLTFTLVEGSFRIAYSRVGFELAGGVERVWLRGAVLASDGTTLVLADDGAEPAPDLRVLVRLPNGRPATGAVVRGPWGEVRTDAEGRAIVPRAHAGAMATVGGAGAPTRVTLQPASGSNEIEVRATSGGEVELLVVDELDRPLPYATFAVTQPSGFPWADLDGDVQRIDPYTDARGRRTLRALEPGRVKILASFGSRSAEAEVEVEAGESQRVRIVLPAGDAPAKAPEPPAEEEAPER